jgi:hypothetical protein
MKRSRLCLLLLACGVLIAGCGSLEVHDPLARPEVLEALASLDRPLSVRAGLYVEPGGAEPAPLEHGFRFRTDRYRIRTEVMGILEKAGLFESIREIRIRSARDGTPEAAAAAKGIDLLIRVTPGEERVVYLGRNWAWWPSLAVWLLAWFPSWMMRDEDYAVEISATITILALPEGKPETLAVRSRSVESLNDMERGFHLMGILRVPWCLRESDYRSARRALRRIAWSDFQAALLLALAPQLPALEKEVPPRGPAKDDAPEKK